MLAGQVTLALGLTVLLGVECAELARLRRFSTAAELPHVSRRVIAVVPPMCGAVGMTGGLLLRRGFEGGPWVAAGVVSVIIISVSAAVTLRLLRNGNRPQGRAI